MNLNPEIAATPRSSGSRPAYPCARRARGLRSSSRSVRHERRRRRESGIRTWPAWPGRICRCRHARPYACSVLPSTVMVCWYSRQYSPDRSRTARCGIIVPELPLSGLRHATVCPERPDSSVCWVEFRIANRSALSSDLPTSLPRYAPASAPMATAASCPLPDPICEPASAPSPAPSKVPPVCFWP